MLNRASEATGKTRTHIIKLLMQRAMRDNHKKLKSFSRIKYQSRDDKENWRKLHITVSEYEYEYFLDMRKFFKMSVSFILANAVNRYLNEILEKLLYRDNNIDNYLFRNYVFIKKTIDGVICWQIYWGTIENPIISFINALSGFFSF